MGLQEYFESSVIPCRDCSRDAVLGPYMTFRKLPPFVGNGEKRVLLLGHSPSVRTSSNIATTLDLDNDRRLRRYVVQEVLEPLGIDLQWCYATNAVKCLTTTMPEDIANEVEFMRRSFLRCKKHLMEELVMSQARLVISFSERISTLLQVEFTTDKPVRPMKQLFATLQELRVKGSSIPWIPVVHIPKPKVRQHYFPEQTIRLTALRQDVLRILT